MEVFLMTSMSTSPTRLRLFSEESADQDDSPQLHWTLTQLYRRWFLPQLVLERRDSDRRPLKQSTLAKHNSALACWQALSGDPPIADITVDTVRSFRERLREGVYRRGPLGNERHWGSFARGHHLGFVQRLHAEAARVLPIPGIRRLGVSKGDVTPRRAFSLVEARAIFRECDKRRDAEMWKLRLALHYYTGQRLGTIRALAAEHVQELRGGLWLVIPGSLQKTGHGQQVVCHDHLAWLVRRRLPLLYPGQPLAVIASESAESGRHRELFESAGISHETGMGWHTWRRTNADQIGLTGFPHVQQLARAALDHADLAVTQKHYINHANEARLRMPRLDE
jgi:integrase